MDERNESHQTLHFSVSGEMVTNLAREMLYHQDKLPEAIDLLLAATETDQLSAGDKLLIAVEILNGTKEIVGTYPSDEYRVQECMPQPDQNTIARWCAGIVKRLKDAEKERNELAQKIICISENLSDRERARINLCWREEYDGETRTVFSDPDTLAAERAGAVLHSLTGNDEDSDPVQSFLNRTKSNSDSNYGWLEPNGEFHAVEWGHHQSFARDWLEAKDPDFSPASAKYDAPGDILVEQGWVLLHNPAMGIAIVTRSESRPLTKAQKDFLFDYYIDRDRPKTAQEYLDK